MKKMYFLTSLLLAGYVLASAQSKTEEIPMEATYWDFQTGNVEFVEHRGVAAMKSISHAPRMTAKDVQFKNGTIEFDVEFNESRFVSVYFRQENEQEAECFYLRAGRAGNTKAPDAAQYSSIVKGVTLWDLQGHYQGPATLKAEGWNHIKLVVSGNQTLVYVNDMEQPSLHIPHLEGNTKIGNIALEGKGYFANLVVKADEIEGLSPQSGYDPTSNDPRYLRKWEVTAPVMLPFEQDAISGSVVPNDTTVWQPIIAERLGLINLTRQYGADDESKRRVTWLKKTITSESVQKRTLHLGFSDEVWVLINNRLLYIDKNYYNQPIMKEPNGRISIENTSFNLPLQEGENELMIGVGNFFFGWGIIARLDAVEGLSFD